MELVGHDMYMVRTLSASSLPPSQTTQVEQVSWDFSRQCYPLRGEESQNTGKKSNFPGGWAEEAA